jgi:hypothetical protein
MATLRSWSRAGLLGVTGTGAAWLFLAACSHDWDAFDPRLGAAAIDAGIDADTPDADTPDADADTPDADTPDADTPDADAGPPTHVTAGLLVLYDFEQGSGDVVSDVSGVGDPLDLLIADPAATAWFPGGLAVLAPTLITSSPAAATKVIDGCMATNEITLEIWLRPNNLLQDGPARMITCSLDTGSRNFTLGQQLASYYQARLRVSPLEPNGSPYLPTPLDEGDVTTELTHLQLTRDVAGVRRFYVDGVERATDTVDGDFASWDLGYALSLANEITLERPWLGELHRVAIYDRALTAAEIAQNHGAGP